MSGRSSADPDKLRSYSETGLVMAEDLRLKAQAVKYAIDDYNASGAPRTIDTALGDRALALAEKWRHLDEFVGDVAHGFEALAAIQPGSPGAGVLTFNNTAIIGAGQVGFADRQEAIEAGEQAAATMAEYNSQLGEHGIDPEDLATLIEQIELGQHDPAFAVAFSEALGPDGYVEATATIRVTHQGEATPEALAAVEVLGTTLTTALRTRQGVPEGRGDPDDIELPPDQQLNRDFNDDLLGLDLEPSDGLHAEASAQDLSVLMRYTDPPTHLAVQLADHYLTPALETSVGNWEETALHQAWGPEYGDPVTNYATMLGRNEDASANWLSHSPGGDTTNIEQVLQRDGDNDADGGRALARVVEQGLTHPTRGVTRAELMETAIETIGGDQDEIRNPHMHEALAAGVDHNMDVVDRMINDSWRDPQERDASEGQPEAVDQVHDFLREVMSDDEAAGVVNHATEEHLMEQVRELPPLGAADADQDGVDDRTEALRNIGTVHGVVVAAEGNAIAGDIENYIERQEARADYVNFLVGLVPFQGGVVGSVNDLADVAGVSLGEQAFDFDWDQMTEAQQAVFLDSDRNNALLLAYAADPGHFPTHLNDMSPEELDELYRRAMSPDVYNGNDHDVLTSATWRVVADRMGDR